MCAALNCPQKVGLIVCGPYMYYQLLSSESRPQCVRPLNVLRKWSSLCVALICIYQLLSSESGPQYVRPLIALRKWASLCAALTYV